MGPAGRQYRTQVVRERIDLWSRACINKNESSHVSSRSQGRASLTSARWTSPNDLSFESFHNPPDLLLEHFRKLPQTTLLDMLGLETVGLEVTPGTRLHTARI
jgi:hypothetical protein